jgi:hypothetical protein
VPSIRSGGWGTTVPDVSREAHSQRATSPEFLIWCEEVRASLMATNSGVHGRLLAIVRCW